MSQIWDLIIQSVYPKGTPGYERLLPNRRGPFQTGHQEDRLAALQAFNMAVDADKELPNTRKTVDVTKLGPVSNRFLKVKNMSTDGKGHCCGSNDLGCFI